MPCEIPPIIFPKLSFIFWHKKMFQTLPCACLVSALELAFLWKALALTLQTRIWLLLNSLCFQDLSINKIRKNTLVITTHIYMYTYNYMHMYMCVYVCVFLLYTIHIHIYIWTQVFILMPLVQSNPQSCFLPSFIPYFDVSFP